MTGGRGGCRIAPPPRPCSTLARCARTPARSVRGGIHRALVPFGALIIVNCITLARQEAFASRQPVGRAVLDAVGMGGGFMIALLLMGTIREVLGSGSFLGVGLFGPGYEPWVIMGLPPGGFFTLAFILLTVTWLKRRRAAGASARAMERPDAVAAERAA